MRHQRCVLRHVAPSAELAAHQKNHPGAAGHRAAIRPGQPAVVLLLYFIPYKSVENFYKVAAISVILFFSANVE